MLYNSDYMYSKQNFGYCYFRNEFRTSGYYNNIYCYDMHSEKGKTNKKTRY